MNREETANLLTAMAAFDRRTIGRADVIAWQELLTDVTFEDGLAAVKRWYADNTEWLMPAHIRRLVRDIVRERNVSPWAPGQHGVSRTHPLPEVTDRVRDEGELNASVREMLARLREMLPEGRREDLFPRRTAWAREHRAYLRSHGGEPNPLYRPRPTVCAACGAESEDLPQHHRDYPNGSCVTA